MIDLLDQNRAARAATTLAARFGVRSTEPTVLSNGSNAVIHLAPTPVVARVATITALVRPNVATYLATDLAVAGYLADLGAPVVPPSRELPVGPHQMDGHTITFWTYVPHTPRHTWQTDEVGPRLAELHAALHGFPGELPAVPPIDASDAINFLRKVDGLQPLTETDITDLLTDAEKIIREMVTGRDLVPLHGDAHPGNLLHTPNGPVWTDFEDAWRGPIGWDLACLELTSRLDGHVAVASYPGAPDLPERKPFLAGRSLAELVWSMVFQWRSPNDRHAADIEGYLRSWRDQH
jgi:Phosphotransferase enzyme family